MSPAAVPQEDDKPAAAPADAERRRHNFLVALNFAAVYILWGSTYLGIRAGLRDLPPALMAGSRFTLAGALMLAWLLWRREPLPPRSLLGPIAVTGLLMLLGGNLLVCFAEETVSSGMAAVIVANLPFVFVIVEYFRKDGERLSPLGILGLVVGFSGMLILTWPKIVASTSLGIGTMRGEAMLLLANFCWVFGSIYSRKRLRGVAPLMSTALQMFIAGLALSLLGFLLGEASRFNLTPRAALAVGWLILAGSLLGYSAYMWLLAHVPAVKVSTYAYVNPIIALGLGRLFFDEPLGWRIWAGTAVILGGVAVVNIARVRQA
ncbi:MAG TPA: EamA family transporter [Candidatus Polarisedimenticolia bacterium]|nr:EamA family transporter [Candidatus Polarisedimenticolia bacterium]